MGDKNKNTQKKKQMGANGDLEEFFTNIHDKIPGVTGIVLSDREGVRLLSVGEENSERDAAMAATFSAAADQASKLRIGSCKTIVCYFSESTVIHINYLPLVVTLFGTMETNVGIVFDLAPEIRSSLLPLREQLLANVDLQQ